MRRSSLLFIIFIAIMLTGTGLYPVIFGRERQTYHKKHHEQISEEIIFLSDAGIKAIVSNIEGLDLDISTDSALSTPKITYSPDNLVVDYNDSTATLTIRIGESGDDNRARNTVSVSMPSADSLSSVSGIRSGSVSIAGIECSVLTICPLPASLALSDCRIAVLATGEPTQDEDNFAIAINSSTIGEISSAVPTTAFRLAVTRSTIGTLSAPLP